LCKCFSWRESFLFEATLGAQEQLFNSIFSLHSVTAMPCLSYFEIRHDNMITSLAMIKARHLEVTHHFLSCGFREATHCLDTKGNRHVLRSGSYLIFYAVKYILLVNKSCTPPRIEGGHVFFNYSPQNTVICEKGRNIRVYVSSRNENRDVFSIVC
jgi:hypothetical protein